MVSVVSMVDGGPVPELAAKKLRRSVEVLRLARDVWPFAGKLRVFLAPMVARVCSGLDGRALIEVHNPGTDGDAHHRALLAALRALKRRV